LWLFRFSIAISTLKAETPVAMLYVLLSA
jgi:hypothetical protein